MSITLTNEQYGALMWVLRRIAHGARTSNGPSRNGMGTRLSRDDMMLLARDACDSVGLTYNGEMIREYIKMFGYDERETPLSLTTIERRKIKSIYRKTLTSQKRPLSRIVTLESQ